MTMSEAENTTDAAPRSRGGRGPLVLAIVATAIGLLIVCIAAFFLLRDANIGPFAQQSTVTPFAPAGGGSSSESVLVVADVSDSPGISLTLNVPTTLIVGGKSFNVVGQNVDPTGKWEPEFPDDDTAVWVFGTVVNYALGVDNSNENRAVLEGLEAGDEIRLVTQSGAEYVFVVTTREIVPNNRADIFNQQSPSATIVMLRSEGQDRLVVRGEFQVTEGGTGAGNAPVVAGGAVELGETAQLGDYRMTVNSVSSLFDRPEAPPGFMFFLVNYQIQNAGNVALDTANLRYELHDEFGNRYALNSVASQLGSAPPLFGQLGPGEVRDASAGYQIPAGLTSPTLVWVVTRANDPTGQEVRVRIPFATGGNEAGQNALVVPQSADVSLDGTSVTVVGQLTNTSEQPLIVDETAVTLTSEGTLYLKLSTNPSFPWVVPPGQTMTFSVAFQRPLTSEAVFTVLGQPFLLTGLR